MDTNQVTLANNKKTRISLISGIVSGILWFLVIVLIAPMQAYIFVTSDGLVILLIAFVSVICGIIAVTTGIVSLRQIQKSHEAGKGSALTGILLGVPSLLVFTCLGLILIRYAIAP